MSRILVLSLFILGLALTLAGCGGGEPAASKAEAAQRAEVKPQVVGVVTLHPQSVPMTVTLPGRTAASAVAEIRPQVAGIIERRVFEEGSEVNAGDLLYQIDPRSYQAAFDSAEADLARAEASVPSAEAKEKRFEELAKVKGVSAQDLEDAHAALAEAKAGVAAAKAEVETARINLDYTKVAAPIGGLIGKSSVTQGALVTASQASALATIRQLDPIYVDLTESSVNLLKVRRRMGSGGPPGGGVKAPVDLILEDGTTYAHPGTIEFTEANVDEATGSLTLRASFPNPDHLLLPGSFVRATVTLGADDGVFLLPQRAVSRNPKGEATAMFVSADGKVEMRALTTVRSYGNDWVVAAGVADGDRIVVDGLQKVRDGQSVEADEVRLDADGLVASASAAAAPSSSAD